MSPSVEEKRPFDVQKFFESKGKLAEIINGYSERPEQTSMAVTIDQALNTPQHCLAEAGTGVGKSLAYLVPAIAWAVAHEERVLISTHTKALQMQLIHHELPRVANEACFGQPIRYEICVGAENYVCLLRLIRHANEPQGLGLDQDSDKALAFLLAWSREDVSGLKQDVNEPIPEWLWKKVNINRETCIGRHCPYFEDCFLQLARKKQRQAQVLITNHSFFFANIMTEGKLLPDVGAVILDEAHKIEDVATQFFSDELGQTQLTALLQDIMDPGRGSFLNQITGLSPSQGEELAAKARGCLEKMATWWQALLSTFHSSADTIHYTDELMINHEPPIEDLLKLAHDIDSCREVTDTEEELKAVTFMASRIKQSAIILDDWLARAEPDRVYWAESYKYRNQQQARIIATPLDLSESFKTMVLDVVPSVIMVSATIAVNQQFHYIKNRLGINHALEVVLNSPFPYEEHAALYLPTAMPEPNVGEAYEVKLQEEIVALIKLFQGGVFVLFTNYRLMKQVAKALKELLPEQELLVQGEAPPHQLIKSFQEHRHAVMLGVETFWQGVDVPGEALRCVILTRLPFDVPTHPVYQSRADYLTNHGQNPFVTYALPRAMLMMRQGFGRLIRHHHDRGVVAILDARVQTRSWGKRFITMLPKCEHLNKISSVEGFVEKHFDFKNKSD